jgi:TRAP transporter 4TM/12TM fusion protein
LSTEGIWGTVTGLSASLISIFILFGCFLLATNAAEAFMKVSLIAAGRSPGGAAKVCNVGSAFFGMINGAAVANVATVGNFTIPAMIRLGYRPAFAGAVEATASSGGQITPPVMGAGAFIMAELLNLPYATVALAAVIPAFLFYVCIWASIDVEARRESMRAMDASEIPTWREVLYWRESVPLLATVLVLVVSLFSGRSPALAAFNAIIVNVTLFLVMGPWTRAGWGSRLKAILEGAKGGAANTISLVSLLVCAQIILSLIGLTGIGIKVSETIIYVGASSGLLPLAMLTMTVALVLGMGMPTTAAYLLAAAVCVPGLVNFGLPPIVAHFFVFYGALLSALTPPVCTAVYAASAITRTHWWPIAIESMKLAVMKFALPFFFIFRPEILLLGSGVAIARVLVIGFVACWLFAIGTGGYYLRSVGWPLRILCIAVPLGMISGAWYMDAFGVGLMTLFVIWHRTGANQAKGESAVA